MKWINHLAIAGATTALVNPVLVPVALLGSTAPDWLEWVLDKLGNRVRHRTLTHIMLYWIAGLVFALVLWDFHGILAAFAWGGLSHVLADSFTVTGVPFSPLSDRRFHLFGGRLRTGDSGEYMVAWGIVGVCVVLAMLFKPDGGAGWYPFFPDWGGMYQDGVVDAKEWKDNRLKFF